MARKNWGLMKSTRRLCIFEGYSRYLGFRVLYRTITGFRLSRILWNHNIRGIRGNGTENGNYYNGVIKDWNIHTNFYLIQTILGVLRFYGF